MTGGVAGLLLAAGAGRRFGGPKVLADTGSGPWGRLTADLMVAGGCDRVQVVVGAAAPRATALFYGTPHRVLVNPTWTGGLATSLTLGLRQLAATDAVAALVMLVDLPGVTSEAIRRLTALDLDPDVLAQAGYRGTPGHPVLLGRRHWPDVIATAAGESGAKPYLAAHPPVIVEVGDIADGTDVDRPDVG